MTHENFDLCFIFRDFSTNEPEGSYYHENKITKEFEDLTLDELEVIATLGMGGFGRVELVTTYTFIRCTWLSAGPLFFSLKGKRYLGNNSLFTQFITLTKFLFARM